MTTSVDTLFDAAREAARHAYAPYSKFPVGAAILSPSGRIHRGCNVENASYPVGTCAEAGAIAAMIAAGDTVIDALALVSLKSNPCMPCGACRQRIFEFSNQHTTIHVINDQGHVEHHSPYALLPHAFGPDHLA